MEQQALTETLMAARVSLGDLQDGQRVGGVYAVRERELRRKRNGEPWLRLRIGDAGGTAEAVAWEDAEELYAHCEPGSAVFLSGVFEVSERWGAKVKLSSLRVAEPHVRRRATVERLYRDVPPVEGSRRELEQVLLNLLINAAQAIEGRGVVRVSTALRGSEVEIAVADTGCGIGPDVLERIFDPFFTTKPAGEGTGLGLSISHEIVRRHGGRILVDSAVGQGTEVRVRLPAHGAGAAAEGDVTR